ncbi:MAG: hypothetical protein LBU32_04800 [Clostridiales bacterium]|nr:hypothetical protein [Clostridiales bacterium]
MQFEYHEPARINNAQKQFAPSKPVTAQYQNSALNEDKINPQEKPMYNEALQSKFPESNRANAQEQFAPSRHEPAQYQSHFAHEDAKQLKASNALNSSSEIEHRLSREIALKKEELVKLELSSQREREAFNQLLAQKEALMNEISALKTERDNLKKSSRPSGSLEQPYTEEIFSQSGVGSSSETSYRNASKNTLNTDIILGKKSGDSFIAPEDKESNQIKAGSRIVFDVNSLDDDLQELALELSKIS